MNYLPYKTKFLKDKLSSNSILDTYLVNLGFSKEHIELIINEPQENDYHLMNDLDNMVEQLSKDLEEKKVITIVGDYDADGATSTAILYLILTKLGFTVHYYIPHRVHDGYGISVKIVDKIRKLYPDTNIMLTCDNGIAAVEAVKYAKDEGFKVYITDHHSPDMDNLPKADFLVHPALPGYPFADISGATVAYKVAKALIEKNGIADKELEEYMLQLAAISVVSDVMPVANTVLEKMRVNENRTILKNGIKLMRENPNWRLKVMFDMFKIQNETLDETTIGFYIAPVINAVGRLDNAAEAVAFLVAETVDKAILKCSIMGYLNEERKTLKKECMEEIKKTIDTSNPALIVKSNIHEGIIGIIAGNLSDEYHKPAVVFAECEIDGKKAWKASARSVEGINLYEVLTSINEMDDSIIHAFGGHAGAAGLTVIDTKIDEFEKEFYDTIEKVSNIDVNKYYININASDIEPFAKSLLEIKPLGNGLPKPVIRTNMFINQYDFFYSSRHVKLSNYFKNEIWLYNSLDVFLSNKDNFVNFSLTMDNTEKRMKTYSLNRKDAKAGRWERWKSNDGTKTIFDSIMEVDYGNFMGQVGPIFSIIQCDIKN